MNRYESLDDIEPPSTYAEGLRLGEQLQRARPLAKETKKEARRAFLGIDDGMAKEGMVKRAGFIDGVELPRRPFPWDEDWPHALPRYS